MFKRLLVIISLAVLATACSSSSMLLHKNVHFQRDDAQLTGFIANLEQGNRANIHHKVRTNRSSALMGDKTFAGVYSEWVGTRYRMGGTTKQGIDCSAFMQTAFSSVYGVELPRSTAEQRYLGQQINKSELQKGDLVFFRRNNHVGVYIGNNQFMHASTSQGVTISSLDEDYWARTYTQSRRIL